MKAVRIHAFGGSDQVQVENIPIPVIKPSEALIRVRAAAINPVDWMARERIYTPEGMTRVPLTLGQDFAGVIEKLGTATGHSFHEGDAVFGETWGSFAEYAVVPIHDLVPLPRGINFTLGASLPMPGLTAWQAVNKTAKASRGTRFLIHGASGGVGSFAAQFAKLKGAEVIVTASPPSFEYLRSIGVDEIIDYHKENFESTCKEVDVVLDPIGGNVQARSWSVIKKGGMLINLVGEIDETAARAHGVQGVLFGMKYDTDDLCEIAKLVEQGYVKPHIAQVLPLEEARRGMDLNQSGHSHGKVILKVA